MACCYFSCLLALMFIIGSIYFQYITQKDKVVQKYKDTLPTNLQILYDKISQERLQIYYQGYFLGLIISIIIIIININRKSYKLNNLSMICLVVSISFITNYFYYILTPKTTYMLEHINSPEQNKAWLNIYRTMQYNYHLGMFIGLVAVGFLAFAFRC